VGKIQYGVRNADGTNKRNLVLRLDIYTLFYILKYRKLSK